jgi:ABC-2 type transport system permease protein
MSVTLTIANRDFKGFFGTPLGWIAACIFFLVSGIIFFIMVQMLLMRGQSVDPVGEILGKIIGFLNYINIFIIPAFTMRVMSEEYSTGTYRLLSSAPISSWSVVFGKFLGVLFYFGVLGLMLLIYPLFTVIFTQPDLKVFFSGWFGFILNTAAITSIGIFIGSLTKSPVLSYLGSAFFIILFIFSGFISGMPEEYRHNVNILELSKDFTAGVIKTGSVSTFLTIIFVFLFLSRFVVESRKWRV